MSSVVALHAGYPAFIETICPVYLPQPIDDMHDPNDFGYKTIQRSVDKTMGRSDHLTNFQSLLS